MNQTGKVFVSALLYDEDAMARLEARARTEKDCANVDCVYILHTLREALAKVETKHDWPDFQQEIYEATGAIWYYLGNHNGLLSDPELGLVALIQAETGAPRRAVEAVVVKHVYDSLPWLQTVEPEFLSYDEEATGTAILKMITMFSEMYPRKKHNRRRKVAVQ